MNYKELKNHVAALQKWAQPNMAGKAKDAVSANLAALPKDQFVLSFPFGSSRAVISADGSIADQFALKERLRVAKNSTIDPDIAESDGDKPNEEAMRIAAQLERLKEAKRHSGWLLDPAPDIPDGAAPINKVIKGKSGAELAIPCGITLVIGGADTGKTPIVHLLGHAGDRDYALLRFGEPLKGYCIDQETAAGRLASAIITHRDIVLDSVKDLLARVGGAAMKSGLSREALPLFSDWGAVAATAGSTIYVPVNPSSGDDEVVDLIFEAAKSNATSVLLAENSTNWAFISRQGEGLMRNRGRITTYYDQDGLAAIKDVITERAGSTAGYSGTDSMYVGGPVSDDSLRQAIRRAVTSK